MSEYGVKLPDYHIQFIYQRMIKIKFSYNPNQ